MNEQQQDALAQFMSLTGADDGMAWALLESSAWNLDLAVSQFMENPGQVPGAVGGSGSSRAFYGGDDVRPPEPTKTEILLPAEDVGHSRRRPPPPSSNPFKQSPQSVEPFRNFRREAEQINFTSSFGSSSSAGSTTSAPPSKKPGTKDLAELFRPPFEILFRGSFNDAKAMAERQKKWLMVNIQSAKSFASQTLNRDTWKNKVVMGLVKGSFLFWQQDCDNPDALRFCQYYYKEGAQGNSGFENPFPVVMVLDPRTGQQLATWTGMIEPEVMISNLNYFLELNPSVDEASVPKKAAVPSSKPYAPIDIDEPASATEDNDEELLQAAIMASLGYKEGSGDDSCFEVPPPGPTPVAPQTQPRKRPRDEDVPVEKKEARVEPPPLPAAVPIRIPIVADEPPEGPLATRVILKLSDGRRVIRRFLKSSLVQGVFDWVAVTLPSWIESSSDKMGLAAGDSRDFNLLIMGSPSVSLDPARLSTLQEANVLDAVVLLQFKS
eukprot:gnl/Hemi2/20427_TR6779_c0_g1_i1.p1 gnl/Hemi2/20427_TR6779_c0_g1~~gnl/Hemi2/20427_TR6779_c0_g1_i1.p1  ORF type:complete len:509 (-),score=124.07 gnl/Hemi2/20427_TR6779_c0_g1_i1:286-1767(-)